MARRGNYFAVQTLTVHYGNYLAVKRAQVLLQMAVPSNSALFMGMGVISETA